MSKLILSDGNSMSEPRGAKLQCVSTISRRKGDSVASDFVKSMTVSVSFKITPNTLLILSTDTRTSTVLYHGFLKV